MTVFPFFFWILSYGKEALMIHFVRNPNVQNSNFESLKLTMSSTEHSLLFLNFCRMSRTYFVVHILESGLALVTKAWAVTRWY